MGAGFSAITAGGTSTFTTGSDMVLAAGAVSWRGAGTGVGSGSLAGCGAGSGSGSGTGCGSGWGVGSGAGAGSGATCGSGMGAGSGAGSGVGATSGAAAGATSGAGSGSLAGSGSGAGSGAGCGATSLPQAQPRGAHWMKPPNFSNSSTRQLQTILPSCRMASGQPSHMFWRPSSNRSQGWMTMIDWIWMGCLHSFGLVSSRPKILRRLLLKGARKATFCIHSVQHGRV